MQTIKDVIKYFNYLILIGVPLRIIILIIKISYSPDEIVGIKVKIKHAFIFLLISESVYPIVNLFLSYITKFRV